MSTRKQSSGIHSYGAEKGRCAVVGRTTQPSRAQSCKSSPPNQLPFDLASPPHLLPRGAPQVCLHRHLHLHSKLPGTLGRERHVLMKYLVSVVAADLSKAGTLPHVISSK